MQNNVVQALVEELGQGHATLRFNFRGTGRSSGKHGDGIGELEDVAAAVDLIARSVGRVSVAGYSFGAAVGMRAGMDDPRVVALAGVALPVSMMDGTFLARCTKPKILVAGDADEIGPVTVLERIFGTIPEPREMRVVPGADHFFLGLESEAARAVSEFLGRSMARVRTAR